MVSSRGNAQELELWTEARLRKHRLAESRRSEASSTVRSTRRSWSETSSEAEARAASKTWSKDRAIETGEEVEDGEGDESREEMIKSKFGRELGFWFEEVTSSSCRWRLVLGAWSMTRNLVEGWILVFVAERVFNDYYTDFELCILFCSTSVVKWLFVLSQTNKMVVTNKSKPVDKKTKFIQFHKYVMYVLFIKIYLYIN